MSAAVSATIRLAAALLVLGGLSACDPGPTGRGTAPPGVSQVEHDARVDARRTARRAAYGGPQGGRR